MALYQFTEKQEQAKHEEPQPWSISSLWGAITGHPGYDAGADEPPEYKPEQHSKPLPHTQIIRSDMSAEEVKQLALTAGRSDTKLVVPDTVDTSAIDAAMVEY